MSPQACTSCPVCKKNLPELTGQPINAVTNCGHVFCYECALRLIYIAKKKGGEEDLHPCPICKKPLKKVILTRHAVGTVKMIGQFLATSRPFYFNTIVYYDESVLADELKILVWFQCTGCNMDFTKYLGYFKRNEDTFIYVSKHLKLKHDSYLCKLCFYNLEQFPIEMAHYSSTRQLQRHQRKPFTVGGLEVKHQRCDICTNSDSTYCFFDEKALLTHCNTVHLACKLCEHGSAFFLDVKSLQEHILSQHNGQEDDACKAINFAFLANSKFLSANSISNTITNRKMMDQFAMPTVSLTKPNGNLCTPEGSQFGDSAFTESEGTFSGSNLSLVNSGDDTVDKPSLPLTQFPEMSLYCDGGFRDTLPIGRGRPRNFK